MIPKKIHYCWFGGGELSPLGQKCLLSWQQACPDYELVRHDEHSFDLQSAPAYVREAYEAGLYAFVSDYVRLDALVREGGIYLDTDVELKGDFSAFLDEEAFAGFEDRNHLSTAVLGARAHHPLFTEWRDTYRDRSFYTPEGEMDKTPNPEAFTDLLVRRGLRLGGRQQRVCGVGIYPRAVFSPVDFSTGKLRRSRRTVAIHWFDSSWKSREEKEALRIHYQELRRAKLIYLPNRILRRILGDERYEGLKARLKGGGG